MLEFTLLARDSENYNIIYWALTGISIAPFAPVELISGAGDWTFLPYWVALDVGVSPINGNLLLRGPLVVLGHTNCGAVTEAVDVYLQPSKYLDIATDYSVRCIEDQILLAVRVAAMSLESLYGSRVMKRPGYRVALLEVAVVLNAAWSAYCLRKEFQNRFPDLGVVFGTYDLITGHLRLPLSLPGKITKKEQGLFAPPEDASGFQQLALKVCKGELIQNLIGGARRRSA